MQKRWVSCAAVLTLFVVAGVHGAAQAPASAASPTAESAYTRSEVMIPVRDGVKLHTVILRPANSETSGATLPFLMQRTCYGVATASERSVNASKPELAASGYIFVFQDIRGRYGSEGKFVMNRPIVAPKGKTDVGETTTTPQ